MKPLSHYLARQVHASYHLASIPQAIEELVFNSLDAGANMIQVMANSEQLYFEVKDNGNGIGYEDIKEIGNSYVTSKISSADDLDSLTTYGYHGQFLACLSLISRIEIRSRHSQSSQSYYKVLENGRATVIQPCNHINGTIVTVSNFLKNYPVRTTNITNQHDMACIKKKLERIALMHQDAIFILKDSNNKLLEIPRRKSLLSSFKQMIGDEDCASIHNPEVQGVVCKSGFNAKIHQYLYINRRYVKNLKLSKLIADEFKKQSKTKLEPAFILNIQLHPLTVDFTPSENHFEVDIKDWETVTLAIRSIFPEAQEDTETASIEKENIPPNPVMPTRKSASKAIVPSQPLEVNQVIHGWKQQVPAISPSILPSSAITVQSEFKVDKQTLEDMVVIGQVDCKFIITKVDNYLFAIDQHAAHERVLLERLQQQIYGENGQEVNIHIRQVDIHQAINVHQFTWLEQYEHVINRYRWKYKLYSADREFTLHLTQVGVVLGVALEVEDLLEYAEQLESNGGLRITRPKAVSRVLASKACRSAIMFGDPLSREECVSLLNSLMICRNPFACAHGRPTVAPLAQLPKIPSNQ